MILGKKRRLGRSIDKIDTGEKLKLTEKIEDKDLLVYLGLTNDANPLYIQHDYASQTAYERPIVPTIMLTGIITAAISKYMPGPGSHVTEQHLQFPEHVYHYETIDIQLEVKQVDKENNFIVIQVEATKEDGSVVITGSMTVIPPVMKDHLTTQAMENF
ncbi:MaoC/PaaZ C-terminal domain-containing protein [Sporosarcina saromensis]|uniref:MaoC/PaaZ C-terminal domain-containing protein n=1 Tax=Sporosarcina saromensis TaxID=359365 RepID=A0ABU4G7J6_9BACL|nr:MaoC/PaaZ C-terminal domain-containing protein [Sporosarcina saromensis]MDW0112886.1 MaoC/PaaZ C-terminal domain-containing protein [Sporosarcina saromensis]